jgi:hypothetical protein
VDAQHGFPPEIFTALLLNNHTLFTHAGTAAVGPDIEGARVPRGDGQVARVTGMNMYGWCECALLLQ